MTIHVEIPEELYRRAAQLAASQELSLDTMLSAALVETVYSASTAASIIAAIA